MEKITKMTQDDSLDRIEDVLKQWERDMNEHKRIGEIREALMNARTTSEVNNIAEANINFIDRVGMWRAVNKAKKRILAIRRECNLSFKNQLN